MDLSNSAFIVLTCWHVTGYEIADLPLEALCSTDLQVLRNVHCEKSQEIG